VTLLAHDGYLVFLAVVVGNASQRFQRAIAPAFDALVFVAEQGDEGEGHRHGGLHRNLQGVVVLGLEDQAVLADLAAVAQHVEDHRRVGGRYRGFLCHLPCRLLRGGRKADGGQQRRHQKQGTEHHGGGRQRPKAAQKKA